VLLRAEAGNTMPVPEEFRDLDAVPLEWRRGVAHLGRRETSRQTDGISSLSIAIGSSSTAGRSALLKQDGAQYSCSAAFL
jgi:hypothetical protein